MNRFFFHDVDLLAKRIIGHTLQLDQFSPGPFQGKLQEIRIDDVQFLREGANRALLKHGTKSPAMTSFSISLDDAHGEIYCNDAPISNTALLVTQGTDLPELRTTDRYDVAILTVPTACLQDLASDEGRIQRNAVGIRTLPATHHAALKTLLLTIADAASGDSAVFSMAQTRKALRDTLLLELGRLNDGGAHDAQTSPRLSSTARRQIVSRVRELVMTRPDAPFTVLDLCRELNVSRRKLQYSFEETLGTHPTWYLRVLRLNAVRRELRRQSSMDVSVGDVAYRWGFWHLSRFAMHYRQLFGELPSDTLKRAPFLPSA